MRSPFIENGRAFLCACISFNRRCEYAAQVVCSIIPDQHGFADKANF